jgi:pimeloyl-ACP methyl ester carboxylesterase
VSELEKRRWRTTGGELAYLELGDPEDPPIVLLHGFPTSSFLWRRFAPLFSPWMRVIVPDLLGCGDSEKPPGVDLGLVAQSRYVRELLGGLGVSTVAAVGHGFGGGVAQLLALEGGARAMVLIDTIAFDAWPSSAALEARARTSVTDPATVEEHVSRFLAAGMRLPEHLEDGAREEYLRPWRGPEGAAAFSRFLRGLDGLGLAGVEPRLERLEIPVLVLWGEEDPYLPPELAERLGDAMPTAAVALLPGCSHLLPEDAPETIAPLMFEYLRSRYLGAPHTHAAGPVAVELGRRPPGEEEG